VAPTLLTALPPSHCERASLEGKLSTGQQVHVANIRRAATTNDETVEANLHVVVAAPEFRKWKAVIAGQTSVQNRSIRTRQYIILCTVQTTAHPI
jgi:hypothetical protein